MNYKKISDIDFGVDAKQNFLPIINTGKKTPAGTGRATHTAVRMNCKIKL